MPASDSRRRAVRALVFDLDGVLRHFDLAHQTAVETAHGLRPGVLASTAFAPDLAHALLTGELTRQQWGQAIGVAIGSPQAATDWLAGRATVDDAMIDLVDQLRVATTTLVVCVLTNGTDETADELIESGIADRFDHVFNSADIGTAKPSAEIYGHVCQVLGLSAEQIFFADDSERNVQAAAESGWTAHRFTDRPGLLAALGESGISLI